MTCQGKATPGPKGLGWGAACPLRAKAVTSTTVTRIRFMALIEVDIIYFVNGCRVNMFLPFQLVPSVEKMWLGMML
jgi:hypothetical protein